MGIGRDNNKKIFFFFFESNFTRVYIIIENFLFRFSFSFFFFCRCENYSNENIRKIEKNRKGKGEKNKGREKGNVDFFFISIFGESFPTFQSRFLPKVIVNKDLVPFRTRFRFDFHRRIPFHRNVSRCARFKRQLRAVIDGATV